MPHRAPGSPARGPRQYLSGRPITYYRPTGDPAVRALIDHGFQAFNAGRLSEACSIFADKMLAPKNDTTIGLTVAGAMTPAGLGGCVIEMLERGLVDFVISTGANLYHDLHYALNFTLRRGSPFLDARAPVLLGRVAKRGVPVVARHLVGAGDVAATRDAYAAAGVSADVVPYVNDMAAEYASADFVITSAGAVTSRAPGPASKRRSARTRTTRRFKISPA